MSGCNGLHDYMNRRMTPGERSDFERHFQTCDGCRTSVESWAEIQGGLKAYLDEVIPEPNEFFARALVRRAETVATSSGAPVWLRPAILGGVAAAAAVLVMMMIPFKDVDSVRRPLPVPATFEVLYPVSSGTTTAKVAPEMLSSSGNDGLLVKLGRGQFGLGVESRARIRRADQTAIHLELEKGTVGVDIPPSKKRATYTIQAGVYTVRVVGTRFWVSRPGAESVEVGVERGLVKIVEPGGGVRELRAGEKLVVKHVGDLAVETVDDADQVILEGLLSPAVKTAEADNDKLPDEKQPMAEMPEEERAGGDVVARRKGGGPPSRDLIKQWILAGEFQRAERSLKGRLSVAPNDMSLLSLLAICQRKSGDAQAALLTYRKIIDRGAPSERNPARLKAGVILQDQLGRHSDAIAMFDSYLRESPTQRPNTVEARMRLARSLNRVGQDRRYRQVLETIVKEHGGTEAAVKASRQLERLKDSGR